VIAVEEVPTEETSHYGIIEPAELSSSTARDATRQRPDLPALIGDAAASCGLTGEPMRVVNLVEKPKPAEAPSNLAIAGRYVFSPLIFDMIRAVKPDGRGEVQLTDAIQRLCEEGRRVLAVKLPPTEKRYDIGNFPSYFETFVEFALADPIYGPEFRRRIEKMLGIGETVQTAGRR
jgi:UTP-glucose-1-phosphate uridylyltransferase